jgi:hypothetical protein
LLVLVVKQTALKAVAAVDIRVALFTTRAGRGLLDNGDGSYQFFERQD